MPADYCFDGIQSTINIVENNNVINFNCIFWYLEKGACLTAALNIIFSLQEDRVKYKLLISAQNDDFSESKLWKEVYLYVAGARPDFSWEKEFQGEVN